MTELSTAERDFQLVNDNRRVAGSWQVAIVAARDREDKPYCQVFADSFPEPEGDTSAQRLADVVLETIRTCETPAKEQKVYIITPAGTSYAYSP